MRGSRIPPPDVVLPALGQDNEPATERLAGIRTAEHLLNKALEANGLGRSVEAAQLLHEALRVLPIVPGEPVATKIRIRVFAALAYAEAETGSVVDGLIHVGTAADLVGALPDTPERLALKGFIDNQLALILLRSGRTAKAIEVYDWAIPVLEQAHAEGTGDPELLAKTFLNRGLAYIELGKPEPAKQDMERCIALASAIPVTRLIAKGEGNLGVIAQLVGDIPTALRYHAHVEQTFRNLAPGLAARTKIDQARALLTAGLADEAARQLDEALPVLRGLRISQDLAEAELARSAAALLQGNLELARELAGLAQRRFVKRGSSSWAEVAALTRMQAEANADLTGRHHNASPRRAAKLAQRLAALGLTDEAAKATMLAVRLALRRGMTATAQRLLGQVPAPNKITPIDHKMMLRLCRAELWLAKGDRRRTLAEARVGLAELSRVRDRMGGLDLLCGAAVHGLELGSLAVGLVLDSARTEADARRLLAWQERTRAQVYRYEPLPAIDDPGLAKRVTELRGVLRAVQLARVRGRPTADLELRSGVLQREVAKFGWHTSAWGRPRPVCTPKEIIEGVADRALVSFVGPGTTLAAVVVSGGRTRLVRLCAKEEALETARQLHADLDALAPDDLLEPMRLAVSRSADRRIARLDQLLLHPLAHLLGDREVVMVPFGGLYSVPWGSLPTLRGRPVSVSPSATAWLNATALPTPATGADVVLVSGPGVPHAVSELAHLRAIYPSAVVLDGERATTHAVLSAIDGARLVHLAAHGTHEPANALFSRLELVDGGLLAHELTRLRKPPVHVVLAACELALRHIRPGDEALGFADALLASGSRTVIAALCHVGDRTTAQTMTQYHRRLANGDSAAALAETTAADPLRRPFICLGAG